MATIDDLDLQTAEGAAISAGDLLLALLGLLERDEAAREWAARIIGPAAPRGEPGPPGDSGPPGMAWVPDLSVNRDGCLEIVRWFEWPADKPPPTGVLGEDGIINEELDAKRHLERIVVGLIDEIMHDRDCDETETRAFLQQDREAFVKAIVEQCGKF